MDFKLKNRISALRIPVLILYLLTSFNSNADQQPIVIVTDHQTQQHYQRIISAIKHSLSTHGLSIQTLNFDQDQLIERTILDQQSCIISIGSQSFERIQKRASSCSMSLLITKSHFQESSNEFRHNASAIFINQPLRRITNVLRKTLKYTQKASMVVSENWSEDIDIKNIGMDLYIKHVGPKDSIIQAFRKASHNTDFVIAIPDAKIYNKNNIKNILLTTYKAKTPLIGYSKALSKAGAVISVYTPADYLGRQAAEWVTHGYKKTVGPPKYYVVELNNKVAESLNIKLKNEALFKKAIWSDRNE